MADKIGFVMCTQRKIVSLRTAFSFQWFIIIKEYKEPAIFA